MPPPKPGRFSRTPTRAELTAARRAAHGLAASGRAHIHHMPGADPDGDAGYRNYLVLAKPNVIMTDVRLRGLAVAGTEAARRKSPHKVDLGLRDAFPVKRPCRALKWIT